MIQRKKVPASSEALVSMELVVSDRPPCRSPNTNLRCL
jgi:hypothetical protein